MGILDMKLVRRLSTLLVLPFLTGCVSSTMLVSDNTTAVAVVSNMTATEISFSCKKAEGTTIYSFNIKESNSTYIKTDVTVEAGTVSFIITDSEKLEMYNETLDSSRNYEITMGKPGKYRIEINHKQFQGKYKLNWAK